LQRNPACKIEPSAVELSKANGLVEDPTVGPKGGSPARQRSRQSEPSATPFRATIPGQDFTMTKNIPGTRQNPEGIPQEGHGGSNTRGTQHKQGKDGNGAQKREQEKKS
jgi:hypothetical protein